MLRPRWPAFAERAPQDCAPTDPASRALYVLNNARVAACSSGVAAAMVEFAG